MALQPQWSGAIERGERQTEIVARPPGRLLYSTGESYDIADRLPAKGRRKLVELRQFRDDLSAVWDAAFADWNEAREERGKAAQQLATLTDPSAAMRVGREQVYGPQHPFVVDAQRHLDLANARLADVTARRDKTAEKRARFIRLITRCERYLATLPRDEEVVGYDGGIPDLDPGETAASALERVRGEREDLKADLHRVRSAPVPVSVAKAKIKSDIEELAKRGAPSLSHLIEFGGDVRWPSASLPIEFDGAFAVVPPPDGSSAPQLAPLRGYPRAETVDTFALFVWLHRDALLKKLNAEADALADDEAALTEEERVEREGALFARLLDAERREEAFVEMAGDPLARRPEVDPRAFLEIVGPDPDPRRVYS